MHNQEKPFQNDEHTIKTKKLEIMEIFCVMFFNVDHRCLFNYMSYLTSKQQSIREDDLLKFANASNILVDFVQSFFISKYQILQRKDTKKKSTLYKIDFNFFKILPNLMEKIIKNLNDAKQPFLDERVKTLKICKKCKIVRSLAEAQFGFQCGNHINGTICGSNLLEDVLRNEDELTRIQKLISIMQVVKTKKKQVEDLQSDLQKRKMQQKQSNQQKKINQIDKFMYQIQTVLKENNIEYPKIPITYANIKQAQILHAPLIQYKKVNQMIQYKKRMSNLKKI